MNAMASKITSLTIVYSTVYVRRRSKETSKVTGEFPAQRASNADNVSIWWRQNVQIEQHMLYTQTPTLIEPRYGPLGFARLYYDMPIGFYHMKYRIYKWFPICV